MFTGIIKSMAKIENISKYEDNIDFYLSVNKLNKLKIDQSIAHNGVCLTVVDIIDNTYKVTAIKETLAKSNLKYLKINDLVNFERCIKLNSRLDGHIVQGHIDTIGEITNIENQNGSFLLSISYKDTKYITVEKGSVCVNGISLTVINSETNSFSVAIIPYTWENTNLHTLKLGSIVNLEFDLIGKYIEKLYKNLDV